MKNVEELLNQLNLNSNISLHDIPEIDLYMDQVIQLFESKFGGLKRSKDDKVLTKTMINNYAKGKLFFPIKNKKYSKQHLILISLIYQMKGALSINDIKTVLDPLNEKMMEGNFQIEELYENFLQISEQNVSEFEKDIKNQAAAVSGYMGEAFAGDEDYEMLNQIVLIASLVHMSSLYRRMAERIVDDMIEERKPLKNKD